MGAVPDRGSTANGCVTMWAKYIFNRSNQLWGRGLEEALRCVSTERLAVMLWRWNITVTCITVTILSSPNTYWATSKKCTCWSWHLQTSSDSSGMTSVISCRATVWSPRCALLATAAARATASLKLRTERTVSITYAPATRLSSPTLTNRCA